jgi:DNA primase
LAPALPNVRGIDVSERDDLVLDAIAGRRVSATGWARGNCPFCELSTGTADKRQCLGVHVFTGEWHCFRCGTAGLLQDVPENVEALDRRETKAEKTKIELPEGFLPLFEEPGLTFPFTDAARAYLERRGLSAAVGLEAKIGVVLTGRYRGRVVVPIFDPLGRVLVGWSARSYVESPFPKYLYPTGMDRRSIVYNGAALLRDTADPIFAVEGVFDALALWPDAIAFLGKPSAPQIEALVSSKRPVVALLDGDAWRESLALMLRLMLRGHAAGSVRLPPRLDPATVDAEAVRRAGALSLARGAQVLFSEAA